MAEHDHRRARDHRARDVEITGLEAGEIPDEGRREFEMRIVGEQWLAGDAVGAVDDPIVGGALRRAVIGQRVQHAVQQRPIRQRRQFPERDRRVLGVVGKQAVHFARGQQMRQPGALQFLPIVTAVLQFQQFSDHQAIGRRPIIRSITKYRELDRQRLSTVQESVDSGRIGVENGPEFGRHGVHADGGPPVDPQCPHEAVAPEGRISHDLRQPPGAETALHVHLEQPVLGVHKAERHIEIMAAGSRDRGDAVSVTHHPDRLFKTRQHQIAGGLGH